MSFAKEVKSHQNDKENPNPNPNPSSPLKKRAPRWSDLWLKHTKSKPLDQMVVAAAAAMQLHSLTSPRKSNSNAVIPNFSIIDRTLLLSDVILLKILSMLPDSDSQRNSNSLVCKRWLNLQGRLVRSIRILDWNFVLSGRLIHRFPNLNHVDLIPGCLILAQSLKSSSVLMSGSVLSMGIDSGSSPSWFNCEENMLPVEVIDNGLTALAGACPNLRRVQVIGASEMGLLSVAEECPTLMELELQRCSDNVLRGIAACGNLQILTNSNMQLHPQLPFAVSSLNSVHRLTSKMTNTVVPTVKNECLTVRDRVILTRVPENIVVSPVSTGSAFLGATSPIPSSRHVFTLGTLLGFRLLSLFRVKIWWMIPRVGRSASDVPMETQLLLVEAREEAALKPDFSSDSREQEEENVSYILFLPVLDGAFRATLQGTAFNELQLCVESGDACVQTSQSLEAVFVNSGDNPFELIKDSIKILEKHKGTFCHLENKEIPVHLDWFGWCTWDAFYTLVNPQGIKDGIQSLSSGGFTPKFVIVDDGWQETFNEFHKEGEPIVEGTQFATRLIDIKENRKFSSAGSNNSCNNLHDFVHSIKHNLGVKYVYMWHALAGYWGGVLPSSDAMKKYNPKLMYPIQSPGNTGNLRDIAMDSLEKYGVGIIDPSKLYEFYNDFHKYLASCGVDGVKVDVQNLIETLGSGYGGRVSLTKQHQEALETSISRNFKRNNLICCMCHNSDSIYSSNKSAVARASEDFMPREPSFQTLHIASVAFNSLLLGEIFVPDWDMFHSKHETAEFHAAARAIGGCAVYVSDKPGNHDFKILKKLVLPNGSVLRAKYAGRPTRDCLFQDPVMDGKSLLKIWNLNKLTGVIGVFNCQGAGSWPMKSSEVTPTPLTISEKIRPLDVEFLEDIASENWNGDCVLYAFSAGLLSKLPSRGKLQVSLKTLQCEVYTVTPIQVFGHDVQFAPIGLLDMYNSGGAVEELSCSMDDSDCVIVKVKSRGGGRFGAYSNVRPKRCLVDMKEEEFCYNSEDGLLKIKLDGEGNSKDIELIF